MKKTLTIMIILFILFSFTAIYAAEEKNILETESASEIIKIKEDTATEIDRYIEKYGTKQYGITAFVLNKLRIFSIPFCFAGIAIGALFQFAVGTRRLDMKHRGYGLIITFITLLVIFQALPLIYVLVVVGWRG